MEATEGKYVQSRSVRLRVPRDSIFGALMPTTRIRPDVELSLDGHAYLPKVDDPKYDWVASVAIPALRALSEKLKAQGRAVREFCTIGTGTGTDALAAVEILKPRPVRVVVVGGRVVDVGGDPDHVADPLPTEEPKQVGDLELAPERRAVLLRDALRT